jgi:hypothetical protein
VDPQPNDQEPPDLARVALAGIVLALTVAGVTFHVIVRNGLKQTAALFIGVPALLALVLALSPRAKTPLGMVMKGLTIALLLSGPILAEGFICILMAAPLFYGVGLTIGLILNAVARHKKRRQTLYAVAFLLPQALEGTHESLSFPRHENVTVTRTVAGSAAHVEEALGRRPRFNRLLPPFLRLGFPVPGVALGEGLDVGDVRFVRFRNGAADMGEAAFVVWERTPQRVVFRPAHDTTPIADWLSWSEAEVTWSAVSPTHPRVTWTLRYERRLDPAWYFGPWERYGVTLAAGYLVDTLATPVPEHE